MFILDSVFVVEMQGLRDNQPREVLVTAEPSQASEAGKSRRKTKRRSKRRQKSGDVASNDATSEECSTEMQSSIQNKAGHSSHSKLKQSLSFQPTRDRQPPSAGGGEDNQTQPSDDYESREFFEVKRYPAYHYDMYGTIYSLTDGVRPSTLEKGTIKSASADCLDVLGVTAQLSERTASVEDVNSSVPQSSAVTAEQHKRKPILPVKPLKPLPRPKPRAKQSGESNKDTAMQSATTSASTDPAFVAELSSLLKQRNQ